MSSTVDIALKYGFKSAGAIVKVVKMRRPTVADVLAGDKATGSEGEKEVAIFANLCELSPDEIKSMDFADYKLLQKAYSGFF